MIITTDSSRITTNDYIDQSGCSLNLQYWRLSKLQLCSKIRFTKLWVLLLFIKELFSSSRQSTHNFSNLFHQHQVLLFHFYHIPILFHFLIHLCLLLSRVLSWNFAIKLTCIDIKWTWTSYGNLRLEYYWRKGFVISVSLSWTVNALGQILTDLLVRELKKSLSELVVSNFHQ